MQTPVRLQTTSHLLSSIPLSCMAIISKVQSFVTFSPKQLSQLIASWRKSALGKWLRRKKISAHSKRFPTVSKTWSQRKTEHTLLLKSGKFWPKETKDSPINYDFPPINHKIGKTNFLTRWLFFNILLDFAYSDPVSLALILPL